MHLNYTHTCMQADVQIVVCQDKCTGMYAFEISDHLTLDDTTFLTSPSGYDRHMGHQESFFTKRIHGFAEELTHQSTHNL